MNGPVRGGGVRNSAEEPGQEKKCDERSRETAVHPDSLAFLRVEPPPISIGVIYEAMWPKDFDNGCKWGDV
jgi:hypothetical protein